MNYTAYKLSGGDRKDAIAPSPYRLALIGGSEASPHYFKYRKIGKIMGSEFISAIKGVTRKEEIRIGIRLLVV